MSKRANRVGFVAGVCDPGPGLAEPGYIARNLPLIAGLEGVPVIMKPSQEPHAKILSHAEGIGVPCPDDIRKRAEELARINGHAEVTEADWREAKRELHGGGHELLSTEGDEQMVESISGGDPVVGSVGRQLEKFALNDENAISEELVAEGMDEAVHEQMLEASRPTDEELEEEEEG